MGGGWELETVGGGGEREGEGGVEGGVGGVVGRGLWVRRRGGGVTGVE